jgi:hypothetical protein
MVSLLLSPEATLGSLHQHITTASVLPPTSLSVMDSIQHNYTLAMQEYMHLQYQREELCVQLDRIRPTLNSGSSHSTLSSPSSSPTRSSSSSSISSSSSHRRHSRSGERDGHRRSHRQHAKAHARCSGWLERPETLDTIPDEETMHEISAEESQLYDVNESIKRALTELLNCDAVRNNSSMRMWVQSRLMETEKELRSGRRRRSSATDV